MIDRKRYEEFEEIEAAFSSTKEIRDSLDFISPLVMEWDMDRRQKGFDYKTSRVGLIVTVDSESIEMDDVLSRNGNVLTIYIPYSEVQSAVINNPKIKSFEVCSKEIVKLLQSNQDREITIKAPWSGLNGSDWDSPGYNAFWDPIEQNFDKKVELLKRLGKKVKIV